MLFDKHFFPLKAMLYYFMKNQTNNFKGKITEVKIFSMRIKMVVCITKIIEYQFIFHNLIENTLIFKKI